MTKEMEETLEIDVIVMSYVEYLMIKFRNNLKFVYTLPFFRENVMLFNLMIV